VRSLLTPNDPGTRHARPPIRDGPARLASAHTDHDDRGHARAPRPFHTRPMPNSHGGATEGGTPSCSRRLAAWRRADTAQNALSRPCWAVAQPYRIECRDLRADGFSGRLCVVSEIRWAAIGCSVAWPRVGKPREARTRLRSCSRASLTQTARTSDRVAASRCKR
jgi:hypothetical protein